MKDIPGEDVQVLLDGDSAQKLANTKEWEWFIEQLDQQIFVRTERLADAVDWDEHQQNVGYMRALKDVKQSLSLLIEEAQDAQEFYEV